MPEVGQWGPQPFTDRRGRPRPDVSLRVFEDDGTTPATLYTSQAGTTTLAQPLAIGVADGDPGVDAQGNAIFYATPGPYVLAASLDGTEVWRAPITVDVDTETDTAAAAAVAAEAAARAAADAALLAADTAEATARAAADTALAAADAANTAADAAAASADDARLDALEATTAALPETIRDTIATAITAGANITITVNDPGDTITVAVSGLTHSELSDFTEAVQDVVAGVIVAGSHISATYSDVGNTLTLAVTGLASTDVSDFAEAARDTIGSALVAGSGITITVNDAGDTITIAKSPNNRFLGWYIDGVQAAGNGLGPIWRLDADLAITAAGATANAKVAPITSAYEWDTQTADSPDGPWTSIYTMRPTIAAGSKVSTDGTLAVASIAAGKFVRHCVVAAGGTPAQSVTTRVAGTS